MDSEQDVSPDHVLKILVQFLLFRQSSLPEEYNFFALSPPVPVVLEFIQDSSLCSLSSCFKQRHITCQAALSRGFHFLWCYLKFRLIFWSDLFCLVLAIAHWILEAKLQAAEEILCSINLLISNMFSRTSPSPVLPPHHLSVKTGEDSNWR